MQAVPLALEQLRRGGIVVLIDQDGAGHLVLPAEFATSETVSLMSGPGRDRGCVALGETDRARLGLSRTEALTAGLVAAGAHGLRLLADPAKGPGQSAALPPLRMLVAEVGGVLYHAGLAEAAVDLVRLAGLRPVTALCGLVQQDGEPALHREIASLAARHSLPVVTIADVVGHRQRTEATVDLVSVADLPSAYSDTPFRAHSFRSRFDGTEHMALVAQGTAQGAPLVRVHSECLTGDAFGSLRCDCGPQLQESMRRLSNTPGGILVYLRGHEGRGIGLANKMRAYALQDGGMDTVEANRALGLPEDARDYAQAAQILRALGHHQVRLLSNNPDKVAALQRHGIEVTRLEPLVIPANPFNARYLETKAQKFGHALPLRTPLPA